MPTPHPKLIDLDFPKGAAEIRPGASPIIPMPGQSPSAEGGATAEVRGLIDQLQQTAWEARARLRAVEEERDGLAARHEEAQRCIGELRTRISDTGNFAQERETLQKEVQRYARAAQDREGRAMQAEKQTQELQRRCDDLTRQRDELNRSLSAASKASVAGGPRPPEVEAQLFSLRQARDSAQERNRELTGRLAQAEEELATLREAHETADPTRHAQEVAALQTRLAAREAELAASCVGGSPGNPSESARGEITALQQQREEVLVQLEIVSKEVLGLRAQLQERVGEVEAQRAGLEEAARLRTELNLSLAPLRADLAEARQDYEQALTSLTAAQKQIEHIIRERDEMREEATRQALVLETELERQREQLEHHQKADAASRTVQAQVERLEAELELTQAVKAELTDRFEAQRLQTIDLAARLEAEQYEIRQMSARLAEARLLVKASGMRVEDAPEIRVEIPLPPPMAVAEPVALPTGFDSAVALEAIRAMRRCYHAFSKTPDDFSHLNELHAQIHHVAEHAQAAGFVALHRMVSAFDAFIQELYHFPEQINPNSLNTIPQSIEFLASLMKLPDPRVLRDAADLTVYVVEDDPLTCECLTMAMETSMMRGVCSQDPAKAACELASLPCDLILLDINMPGMDGFELCANIRGLALHRDTPVMFCSGMDSPDMRARASLVGACDFLPKPFILCELTLKALLHIAKAQLRLA